MGSTEEPERWPRAFGGSTRSWEVAGSGLEARGPNPPPVLEPRGQKTKSGSQPISVHFGTQPPSSHMADGRLCAPGAESPSHRVIEPNLFTICPLTEEVCRLCPNHMGGTGSRPLSFCFFLLSADCLSQILTESPKSENISCS